jgi:beta-N-acetylhexosaminidase
MTAHVFNARLDRDDPATLSAPTITGLLRERLGFQGVVVSDDLRMGAIEQRYGIERAALLTLLAGADLVLIADDRLPDGRSAAEVTLGVLRGALADGRLPLERVTAALARVRQLKGRAERGGGAPTRTSATEELRGLGPRRQ